MKIGATGFGGPLVTTKLMGDAFVGDFHWLSQREFLERLGLVKLLPGPVSSLLALSLGRKFFGLWASLLGLLCFLLPPYLLVLLWAHNEEFLRLLVPHDVGEAMLWSFRYYLIAIISVSAAKILRDAWLSFPVTGKSRGGIFLSLMGVAMTSVYFERLEIEIIGLALLAGFLMFLWLPGKRQLNSASFFAIFWIFLVASLVVFGTGYMLFPYIERELVMNGQLSRNDFEIGLLLGNMSPGPVVIGASYYGWKLGGFWGSLAATAGVFGGPIFLISLLYHPLEKLRARALVQYLSLCAIPAVVVVLFRFNWSILSQEIVRVPALAAMLGFAGIAACFPKFRWHVLGFAFVSALRWGL